MVNTLLPVFGNIHPVTRCVDVEVKEVGELVVQEVLSISDAQKRLYFTR
jgi:hypothetical protein